MSRCRHEGTELVLTELGFDVRLEPEVLTPLGELRVILAGGRTYTRHVYSGAVHHRGAYEIRTRPAGSRPRQDVHAGHRCPAPLTPGES